jgi:ribose transport system substrate-binding protein
MVKSYLRCFAVWVLIWSFSPALLLAEPQVNNGRQYVVAFAQDTLANDWRNAQVRQMAEAFQPYPHIKFIYTNGEGQSAKQIYDIEGLINQHVDVLVTSPRDGAATTPVVAKAYKLGIPVVMVSRNITSEDYTSFVAPDNYQIAVHAGKYIAERLQGKGRVVMLRGVATASTAQLRAKGFEDALQAYPDIQIVADKAANYLRADAILAVEDILNAGIEFDAIYAQSDSMATGARMALKKAGIEPGQKIIVGIDYITEAQEAIRHGEQDASFVYPTCAAEAADLVVRILRGETVPKKVVVDSTMVTKSNVDTVKPIF